MFGSRIELEKLRELEKESRMESELQLKNHPQRIIENLNPKFKFNQIISLIFKGSMMGVIGMSY